MTIGRYLMTGFSASILLDAAGSDTITDQSGTSGHQLHFSVGICSVIQNISSLWDSTRFRTGALTGCYCPKDYQNIGLDY